MKVSRIRSYNTFLSFGTLKDAFVSCKSDRTTRSDHKLPTTSILYFLFPATGTPAVRKEGHPAHFLCTPRGDSFLHLFSHLNLDFFEDRDGLGTRGNDLIYIEDQGGRGSCQLPPPNSNIKAILSLQLNGRQGDASGAVETTQL